MIVNKSVQISLEIRVKIGGTFYIIMVYDEPDDGPPNEKWLLKYTSQRQYRHWYWEDVFTSQIYLY